MWWALGLLCLVGSSLGEPQRDGKLSLFNLVRFDNEMCEGDKRNGTCYTKEECEDRDGKESGTCADGFGVCCILELDCGDSSSDNNTYLVNTNVEAGEGCTYEICPAASSICRIRYDFTENTIASPVAVTNQFDADGAGISPGATGSCVTDSMVISNSGAASSPVICGNNKGQHMVLDSDGKGCQEVVFAIGSKSETRKWEIQVTQFTCNDLEMTQGGPKGCLQYFTGDGNMRSFNFPDAATVGTDGTVTATMVHLNNQQYNICVKKTTGKTRICYTPIGNCAIQEKGTFGISRETAIAAEAHAGTDSACLTDYLSFPGGVAVAADSTAAGKVTAVAKEDVFKVCGRFIGTNGAKDTCATLCSTQTPYVIHVNFDGEEFATDGTNADKKANLDENEHITLDKGAPGTVGFMFAFTQT